MVGDSVAMRALRKQIAVVAPTDGRVLIYGESGTGKELWRAQFTPSLAAPAIRLLKSIPPRYQKS